MAAMAMPVSRGAPAVLLSPSLSSFSNIEDLLLADLAIRIKLNPTNYRKVVERYKTLNEHLERESSPLAGIVALLYPQGSVSIGATIASCTLGTGLTAPAPAIRFSAILKCSSPPLHHSCSSPDDGSQVS